MSTPVITKHQRTAYALSVFAGLADGTDGDIDRRTFERIKASLDRAAGTIGKWKIVWGPCVVQQPLPPAVAMNTMYVAQSADDPSRYIIGIAGTNPISALDWIVEDGFVSWQVSWVYGLFSAPSAKIALGTAIGLLVLQNMIPSSSVPGTGQRLIDFLSSVAKSKASITVTGHSLGGALAPTVALWLADTQGIPFLWDPAGNVAVSALTTAGPTPGNGAFATYVGEKLGASLAPFYNTIDVVPHAWQESMLKEIPTLYVPHIPESGFVSDLVGTAEFLAKNGDYTTLPGLVPLAGTVDRKIIDHHEGPVVNFLKQLAHQHNPAYYPWFDFDADWLPPESKSAPAPAALRPRPIGGEAEHRKLPVGDALMAAPTGPNDPYGPDLVARVESELRKQGAPESAA